MKVLLAAVLFILISSHVANSQSLNARAELVRLEFNILCIMRLSIRVRHHTSLALTIRRFVN